MSDTPQFEYDVFLSYCKSDKDRVRELAQRLKGAGLHVWLDEWVIKPGNDIRVAIDRGLERSRIQVLCLSKAALGSGWFTMESSTVLFRDPSNSDGRVIPILLEDCELPYSLVRLKHIDFCDATTPAFEELLAACRAEMQLPPAPTTEIATKRAEPEKKIGSQDAIHNDHDPPPRNSTVVPKTVTAIVGVVLAACLVVLLAWANTPTPLSSNWQRAVNRIRVTPDRIFAVATEAKNVVPTTGKTLIKDGDEKLLAFEWAGGARVPSKITLESDYVTRCRIGYSFADADEQCWVDSINKDLDIEPDLRRPGTSRLILVVFPFDEEFLRQIRSHGINDCVNVR